MEEVQYQNRIFSKNRTIFMIILMLTQISAIIMAISVKGENFYSFLFPDGGSFFTDFFDVLGYSRSTHIYLEEGTPYPPLILIFMRFIASIIPGGMDVDVQPRDLRFTQTGIVAFFMVMTISAILLATIISHSQKEKFISKNLFLLCIFGSIPFIFTISRGNVLILAVFFSTCFLAGYQSNNPIYRELAYISLALAFSIKLSPALFGILLIREKRYKDSIKCIIYALLIFFIPFLMFYNPLESIACFFNNMRGWGGGSGDLIKSVDFCTTFRRFFIVLSGSGNVDCCLRISRFLTKALFIISIAGILTVKEDYKAVMALAVIVAAYSELSFAYNYLYMVFPFLLFLNNMNMRKVSHILYGIGYFLIMGLITTPDPAVEFMTTTDNVTLFVQLPIVLLGVGGTILFITFSAESVSSIVKKVYFISVNRCGHEQVSLGHFKKTVGVNLKEDNRWVKRAQTIPWRKIEKQYANLLTNREKIADQPFRLALGACIIQEEYGFSDEETVLMIQENPYLQYFCGYSHYDDKKLPFDPSMMASFHELLTPEVLDEIRARGDD